MGRERSPSAIGRVVAWAGARPALVPWLLAAPALLVLVVLFAVPLVLIVGVSGLGRGAWGELEWRLSLDAYVRVLDPLYLRIVARTAVFTLATTAVCALLGFPMAWVVVRGGRWRPLLLLLVVLPFWTSTLVRTYATMFLLRDTGVLNQALLALGLVREPLRLLYSDGAILLGLVTTALPFFVLPLAATLDRIDPALLEAAELLGARPWARFTRVILPLAAPGLAAGSLLVAVPTLGALLVPDLLGGAHGMLLGTLVQEQFGPARDWPFGAAASVLMMVVVLAGAVVALRWRDAAA